MNWACPARPEETTVEDRPVVDAVRSRPDATEPTVAVERDGTRREVVVTTEELPDVAGRVGTGVLLETRGGVKTLDEALAAFRV